MGNKITRRRDTLSISADAAAADEPAATQSADEPEVTQTQEATDTENLEVVVGESVTPVACLPSEECTSECKEAGGPAATLSAQHDAEPKAVAKETPAPVQPELLVSISEPPPKSEPTEEPKPAMEAQLAPEPELTSNLETETEVVPEPSSEEVPAPAEALDQQTDTLTQESQPKPAIASHALIDLGVPDMTLQPVDTAPAPVPIHDLFDVDEHSDIPVTDECQDGAEVTSKPGKAAETSDSLEEASENLEQLVNDVREDSVSGLLKNLELQANDLVPDLIPSDVKVPDDTPVTDICSSTELM